MNYALAPSVSIDEITRQARASLAWVLRYIGEYGGDPERAAIGGHSAGGHLTAMGLQTRWAEDYGLPRDPFKAAVLVSGLFDLQPLPGANHYSAIYGFEQASRLRSRPGDAAGPRCRAAIMPRSRPAPSRTSAYVTQKIAARQHSAISALKRASYAPRGASDGATKSGIAPGGYSTKTSRYGSRPSSSASPYSR